MVPYLEQGAKIDDCTADEAVSTQPTVTETPHCSQAMVPKRLFERGQMQCGNVADGPPAKKSVKVTLPVAESEQSESDSEISID